MRATRNEGFREPCWCVCGSRARLLRASPVVLGDGEGEEIVGHRDGLCLGSTDLFILRWAAGSAGCPNLLQEMREYVSRQTLLERAYAREPHAAQRQRKSTTRTLRFLDAKYGADGNSKRRLDWKQSSIWHYWIDGCLANSSTRFRKYFRVTRTRFDEIYLAAADSGEFRLNPVEPAFDRAFPERTPGKHGDQLPKVCPLCLKIGACLRRLATGEPYSSLETSFQISQTVLLKFFPKFL